MNEKILAERFSQEIDKIVKAVHKPGNTEDYDEYKDELRLAEAILKQDFSKESTLKDDLKKKLLAKFNAPEESNFRPHNKSIYLEDELSEEELDYAAGGHSLKEESACTKCGCKRSRAAITAAICPDCGHSRDEHM